MDSRILEEELAALAIQHREKLTSLEKELKEDEQKVRRSFERERVRGETKYSTLFEGRWPLLYYLEAESRGLDVVRAMHREKLPLVFIHRHAATTLDHRLPRERLILC